MKKTFLALIVLLMIVVFVSCSADSKNSTTEPHWVIFDMNYHGEEIEKQIVPFGQRAQVPTTPTADDFVFLGWYKDSACTKPYNFDSPVKANLVLYAKWERTSVDERLWGKWITTEPPDWDYERGIDLDGDRVEDYYVVVKERRCTLIFTEDSMTTTQTITQMEVYRDSEGYGKNEEISETLSKEEIDRIKDFLCKNYYDESICDCRTINENHYIITVRGAYQILEGEYEFTDENHLVMPLGWLYFEKFERVLN